MENAGNVVKKYGELSVKFELIFPYSPDSQMIFFSFDAFVAQFYFIQETQTLLFLIQVLNNGFQV